MSSEDAAALKRESEDHERERYEELCRRLKEVEPPPSHGTSPPHYRRPYGEVRDVIRDAVKDPASFWHGMALRYLLRANHKHPEPDCDFEKAAECTAFLLEELRDDPS